MLLAKLVDTSRQVAGTSKRLKKVELLADLIRQLKPEESEIAIAFLTGKLRQGNIGVGYALIREAMAPPQPTPELELTTVDRILSELRALRGAGSAQRRREQLHVLFSRATEHEQQFLAGLLGGELRQGALEGIMLDALAKATGVAVERVRRAAMMAGSLPVIAHGLLTSGEEGLAPFTIQLFCPVQPMLAQTAEDVEDAVADMGEAAFEYKFDGARVQAHKRDDDIRIYSRGMNDVTGAAPEIVELVRAMPARELILDGEVLSLDENLRPRPFQMTMRRFGRKLNVEKMRQELPLRPFWFDLIYLNGTSLIDEPQRHRFAALQEVAQHDDIVPHLLTGRATEAEDFLRSALERGHEGVMAKAPGSAYAAGARGQTWLKVKKARTLDLVILAAEWGNGRRKGWLSNLHLGARDDIRGGFAMLGKTFKGLTDEMLAWQTQELLKLEVARDSYTVYVEPKLVAEIAFNEIQVSPRYVSGLALRFARVKRYRTDKTAAEADTFATVQKLAGMAG
jgi:DNA ligase-1